MPLQVFRKKHHAAVVPTADKLCLACGLYGAGERPTAGTIGNLFREDICKFREDFKYSSALFYETGVDNWEFLAHYKD